MSDCSKFSFGVLSLFVILFIPKLHCLQGNIVELGDNLSELIDQNSNKNWLIKFHDPSCPHCQRLEPIFDRVSDKINEEHEDVIVGQVDCSNHTDICENYLVEYYPTVIYLTSETGTIYRGDLSEESLLGFFERFHGPDVKKVRDCHQLESLVDKHGFLVLSTFIDTSREFYVEFEKLAKSLKSSHWFFQIENSCNNTIEADNFYILKRDLRKPIIFTNEQSSDDLMKKLNNWVTRLSFPIYGPVNRKNFKRLLSIGRSLFVALLHKYKDGKNLFYSSEQLHKTFGLFAKESGQHEDGFIFLFTRDLELLQSIAVEEMVAPNIIIIKPDLSYHSLVTKVGLFDESLTSDRITEEGELDLEGLLMDAKENQLKYKGGNSFTNQIQIWCIKNIIEFTRFCKENQTLAGFFLTALLVVVASLYWNMPGKISLPELENLD